MGIISVNEIDTMSFNLMQETHEEEIRLLNEIDDLRVQYQDDESELNELEAKLNQYIKHVKQHFETEESLMQEYGDPNFEMHKMAHDMFMADINYAIMIWNKGDDISKLLSVIQKAPEWLISHINTVDKPTAEFLNTQTGEVKESTQTEINLEEIAYELELAGVTRDKMNKLLRAISRDGFDPKTIDKKLEVMGYTPVFTIYD